MIYVVKVTEAAGQYRITLPKEFCINNEINEVEYLVIDDNNPGNIIIRRLNYGKEGKSNGG